MLRSESVGRDLVTYLHFFLTISQESTDYLFDNNLEIGYAFLNKLISLFTDNFQWVIVITAIMTVIPVWYVYRKESEEAYVTISTFLIMPTFAMAFSGLRQSIAISMGIVAYEFVKNKKPVRFIITVAVAFLFHKSAIILVIMYPLYWAKITKKWLLVVVPAIAAIFAFNKPIFGFLQTLISDYYMTTVSETNAFTMIILFVMFAVFAFVIPDETRCDFDLIGLRNILLLSIVIQMFAPLHTLAMRLNYYFIVFIPLLISKVIKYRSIRFDQVAIWAKYIMIGYFVFYFFNNTYSRNPLDIFPYKFFFGNN